VAAFCENCGGALAPGAGFCTGCGRKLGGPASAPPQAQYAQPVAAKKTSPILIIFGVLALILVLGCGLLAGGIWYASHKARQLARDYNIPLNSAEERAMRNGRESIDACSLVAKSDVEPVLGTAVASTSGDGTLSCMYMPADGGVRHVRIQVTAHGGRLAMKLMEKSLGMIPGAVTTGKLGDGSLMAPMDTAWYVLKGDTLISMEWPDTPGKREEKEALAKKILARL
jgi:hypothetical protein